MQIKHFILAILLLSIGLFFSYEKVSLQEKDKTKEIFIQTGVEQTSHDETTVREVEESILSVVSSEDSITPIDKNVKKTKESAKKETKKTTTKKQVETKTGSSNPKETTVKEELKVEKSEPKEEPKPQCSDLYESITHGKVDRSSRAACVSYGNKIQNNELDEVLDYNEEHGNAKKNTISYYRCYEVVDNNCNTKGWYLHFFCNSGGCDDNKLKSLYG